MNNNSRQFPLVLIIIIAIFIVIFLGGLFSGNSKDKKTTQSVYTNESNIETEIKEKPVIEQKASEIKESTEEDKSTYQIVDDNKIYKVNADTSEKKLVYDAIKYPNQIGDEIYFIKKGDFLKINLTNNEVLKLLDYSDEREANIPIPIKVNKYFIEDEWIYYMLTVDIYTFVYRMKKDGKSNKLIYASYKEHFIDDILEIEGDFIVYTHKDVLNPDSQINTSRFKKDGSSGVRPDYNFILDLIK